MRDPLSLAVIVLTLSLASSGSAVGAATFDMTLSAEVPVTCQVSQRGEIAQTDRGYALGRLIEYCNAPQGFALHVDYAPGSLRGTALKVGDVEVTLDGSGHSEVMRADGPRIRALDLFATAGTAGFDSSSLTFQIVPL